MNYLKIYEKLIETRKTREPVNEYVEKHHIIPKSLGGSNDITNLVDLTGREHYVAHRLLAKIYPKSGMVHAIWRMACADLTTHKYKINSRTYEYLRIQHAKRVSEDEEANKKKGRPGKKQSEEHKRARVESRKKNNKDWHSEKALQNISNSLTGKPSGDRKGKALSTEQQIEGHKKSVETRKRNGSYIRTKEMNEAVSKAQKGIKKPPLTEERKKQIGLQKSFKVKCPHCQVEGANFIMARWHFNNCKKNPVNSGQ